MINKDFLRQIFSEEKKLFKLSEVSWVKVPRYDELSVIKLWPNFKKDAKITVYLPSSLPKGRLPDRDYLFNIVNSIYPEYMQALIRQASDNRFDVRNKHDDLGVVKVSEEWWKKLMEVPFASCKYFFKSNIIRT